MKSRSMTISDVLTVQVEKIVPGRKDLESLMKKRKIRLYLGVDPTGKNLHLGHTIALRKLQQFAELGHEAILVVGTGTVLAGDPSQRASARPHITPEEIEKNMKTWKEQASRVLDFSKIKMRFNGDWLLKLRLPDILQIASNISASQLFQRDMFQARLKRGDTVWTHELLYPLLQGYDSFALDVDLEIGGGDQLFNMLIGRELQKKMRAREKYVLCVPMLTGLDGKPMSKTSGNTVNILDEPQEMYGKLMSMRDELIPHYLEMCCGSPVEEIKGLVPRDAKAKVALRIVALYHGQDAAQKAKNEFDGVFREKKIPSKIPQLEVASAALYLTDLVLKAGWADSKASARRLIEQGGVKIDERAESDPNMLLHPQEGMIVRAGKRRFARLIVHKNTLR